MPRSTEPRLTDDNLEELLGGGNSPTNQFKLYNLRFLILAIFTFSTLSNASLWTTLAPISTDASKYFFDEDGSRKQTINLCSLMYQICYLPGTIVASILTERGGLRSTVLVGSMLTAFGASIRYFSVFFLGGTPTSYVIVVVGQSFAAFGQPMFVNSPGLLAANWFGANERDAATTVASLGAIIGNAVGQLVPPALVSSDEANHVNGMENLMLIQAGIAFAICLLVHFGFYSNPITPPSQSTTDRDIHNNQAKKNRRISRHSEKEKDEMVSFTNNGGGDDKSVLDSLDLLYNSARDLMGNRDYVILLGAFGVGLALFNGLLTVINNFLEPCGYSEDEAGNYAAALIAAGLLGAIVCGVLMEIYHVYRSLLKVLYLCGTLATLFLIFQVDTNNYNNLLLSFAMMGFCFIPMLPTIIENAIECTYPCTEELSAGLLFTVGNVLGIPMTFVMQYLIDWGNSFYGSNVCGNPFTAINLLIFGTSCCCCLLSFFYQGQYLRQKAEQGLK